MAKTNPFRFSTKYQDEETDLLYYGYRYYSASSGRWLSRDPVAEEGGRNIYAFVNENPINNLDLLGLRNCQCGLDVTAAVEAVLKDVDRKYDDLGFWEKGEQCIRMYNVLLQDGVPWRMWRPNLTLASTAWDIEPLKTIGRSGAYNTPPPPFFDGNGTCTRTVTFQGRCYYAGSVNFALWGRMNRRCSKTFGFYSGNIGGSALWSLNIAKVTVPLWKITTWKAFGLEELQAVAFTEFGYTGALPSANIALSGCDANSQPSPPNFKWHWRPHLESGK